jgi:hypothetical protein
MFLTCTPFRATLLNFLAAIVDARVTVTPLSNTNVTGSSSPAECGLRANIIIVAISVSKRSSTLDSLSKQWTITDGDRSRQINRNAVRAGHVFSRRYLIFYFCRRVVVDPTTDNRREMSPFRKRNI